MAIGRNLALAVLAAAISIWLTGCNPAAPPSSTGGSGTTTDGHDHEGHDHGEKGHEGHDHAHDHAHHGPHGGHIMAIGQEQYHAEWTHDEEGKITFYILDAEAKKEVPIAAEKMMIEVKIGDNEPKLYELLAVDPSAEDKKTAQFEIVDKDLLGAIELLDPKKGVAATLNVEIDGTPFSSPIEEHSHDHDHAHEHTEKPAK